MLHLRLRHQLDETNNNPWYIDLLLIWSISFCKMLFVAKAIISITHRRPQTEIWKTLVRGPPAQVWNSNRQISASTSVVLWFSQAAGPLPPYLSGLICFQAYPTLSPTGSPPCLSQVPLLNLFWFGFFFLKWPYLSISWWVFICRLKCLEQSLGLWKSKKGMRHIQGPGAELERSASQRTRTLKGQPKWVTAS